MRDEVSYLCDSDGIAIHEADSGIRNRYFNFTAYLRSAAVTELINSGSSLFSELDHATKAILEGHEDGPQYWAFPKAGVRTFRHDLVKSWRRASIYPYKNTDAGPVEQAERQVLGPIAGMESVSISRTAAL